MTLTLKTAKHAVGKYGEISEIVDDVNDLNARSVTREAATEATGLGYQFTPCIVVTTAREALEAVWELAHETREIPAHTPYVYRASDTNIQVANSAPGDLYAGHGRSRLIDPPKPEPEPWELSRYCYADGEIFKRIRGYDGVYWARPGNEIRYYRDHFTKFNPKPLDPEGETE